MAADPRSYLFNCARQSVVDTNNARSFFESIGKIGDVNALNAVDGGYIGSGLRNLANISGAIRTGKGSLPTSIGTSLNTGANWVLDNTIPTFGATAVDLVRPFNPGVANQAVTQAQLIYQNVQSGTFTSTQIPNYLQDFQNLERLARGIYTPADAVQAQSVPCEYLQYAQALDFYQPKFEFMFAMEFIPDDKYINYFTERNANNVVIPNLVKQFQRPTLTIDYDEINMYNFKTRVPKKVTYKPVQFSFIDDVQNNAMGFLMAYINALSPLSNVPDFSANDSGQQDSMAFDDINNPTHSYTASLGSLLNKTILKEITLLHIYDFGKSLNKYTFLSPRFINIEFDAVNMETSKGNSISTSFVYDGFYVDDKLSLADTKLIDEVKSYTNIGGMPVDPGKGLT